MGHGHPVPGLGQRPARSPGRSPGCRRSPGRTPDTGASDVDVLRRRGHALTASGSIAPRSAVPVGPSRCAERRRGRRVRGCGRRSPSAPAPAPMITSDRAGDHPRPGHVLLLDLVADLLAQLGVHRLAVPRRWPRCGSRRRRSAAICCIAAVSSGTGIDRPVDGDRCRGRCRRRSSRPAPWRPRPAAAASVLGAADGALAVGHHARCGPAPVRRRRPPSVLEKVSMVCRRGDDRLAGGRPLVQLEPGDRVRGRLSGRWSATPARWRCRRTRRARG